MIQDLHSHESETLRQVLAVLDEGLTELKGEVDGFPDIMNPHRVPDQYIDLLWQNLGLPPVIGLSEGDRRAVLSVIGTATHYKGSYHALRLVLRALWRFSTFQESYQEIYQAVVDGDLAQSSEDWPDALETLEKDQSELLRILVKVELSVDDAIEYGREQADVYRQLLDQLEDSSGYENILRTYRPGFDATPTTLLGRNQFNETTVFDTADRLYGPTIALSDDAQAIFESLKWNVYPDLKIERSHEVLEHFIPLIAHVQYQVLGYRAADEVAMEHIGWYTRNPYAEGIYWNVAPSGLSFRGGEYVLESSFSRPSSAEYGTTS